MTVAVKKQQNTSYKSLRHDTKNYTSNMLGKKKKSLKKAINFQSLQLERVMIEGLQ